MSGEHYYAEIVGSGAALFDFDNDGDLDIFFVQGNMLGSGKTLADALTPPATPLPLRSRLYRNDLTSDSGRTPTLHFTDVTDRSGIDAQGYGMGVATGDFDNDGWVDLYVTNFSSNQLWRNQGDGTFRDVTRKAGVDDTRWSMSAAFLDFDRDGWLDLYVANYVHFDFKNRKQCYSHAEAGYYCGPMSYDPVPERLFRNRGDGTFEDVSEKSGIAGEYNGALGVSCADFNGDGWIDIYVANDGRPNHLWINQRDGTFVNDAMTSGTALNEDGESEASMGVDAGDFDNDGDEDLFMTHLVGEKNTLYLNIGEGLFEDRSLDSKLAASSLPYTAFGTGFLDYDNDGRLDLLVVNGDVRTNESMARAKRANMIYRLHQPNQLFRNLGNGKFQDATARAGAAFQLAEVSRGAAFGDVDNDGDTDVLVLNNNGPARLLINDRGSEKHWIGLRMLGANEKRDMLGTRVAVVRGQGPTLWRRARADGSYCSANDPRILAGLGDSTEISRVRAYWPSGRVEEWTDVVVDGYNTLREGTGEEVAGSKAHVGSPAVGSKVKTR